MGLKNANGRIIDPQELKIEALEKEVADLNVALNNSHTVNATLTNTIAELEQRLVKHNAYAVGLEMEVAQLRTSNAELQAKVRTLRSELKHL